MTREDWMENFGENLQDILTEKKLKQSDLAKMTKTPASTISGYVKGRVMPSTEFIVKLAYAIDADYFDLIDFGDTIE